VSSIVVAVHTSYTYDANGNVKGDGSRTLTWTSYNMMAVIVLVWPTWPLSAELYKYL
jgi:uncharacterized protein RhaS with RHS repeats